MLVGEMVENILNLQHPPKTHKEQIKHLTRVAYMIF